MILYKALSEVAEANFSVTVMAASIRTWPQPAASMSIRMLMEAAGWGQVRIEAAITVTEKLASATSLNALYKIIQP